MAAQSSLGFPSTLLEKAKKVLPGGSFGNMPAEVILRDGKGGRIWDEAGKEYVDFVGRNRHGPDLAKQLVHNGVDAALLDNTEKVALHRLFDDEIFALDTERVRRRQRMGPADRITGLQPEGILR